MNIRPWAGLIATAVLVPLTICIGAVALSLIPVLGDGIRPMLFFMLSADGVGGLFFFVYFFGAPVALLIGAAAYWYSAPWLRRDRPIARWRVIVIGAGLGAVILPPVWAVGDIPSVFARYFGPVVLGALSGAVGAASVYWAGSRRSENNVLAA